MVTTTPIRSARREQASFLKCERKAPNFLRPMLRSGGAEALRVNGWGIVMEVEKDGEGNDEAGTFGSGAAAIAKVVVLFKSFSSAIESLFWCTFEVIPSSI